jgi:hypothetical protein
MYLANYTVVLFCLLKCNAGFPPVDISVSRVQHCVSRYRRPLRSRLFFALENENTTADECTLPSAVTHANSAYLRVHGGEGTSVETRYNLI